MLKPVVVGVYSIMIMCGGVMGFVKAHSQTSLIMASAFSVLLMVCVVGMLKGVQKAYMGAQLLTTVLMAFFTYRFFLKMAFMPGGMMAVLSLATLLVLFLGKDRVRAAAKK